MKPPVVLCALLAVLAVNISPAAASTPTATPMPNCATLLPKTLANTLLGSTLISRVFDKENGRGLENPSAKNTINAKSTTGTSWCSYQGAAAEFNFIVWAGNTPLHGAPLAGVTYPIQRTPNANAIYAALSKADPGWCAQVSTPDPQDCTPQAVPGIGAHAVEVGSVTERQIVWQKGGVTFELSHLEAHGKMSDYDQLATIATCVAGGACVPGSAAVVGDTP
jgi:hypothetical protein